jgi:hypothetical protein
VNEGSERSQGSDDVNCLCLARLTSWGTPFALKRSPDGEELYVSPPLRKRSAVTVFVSPIFISNQFAMSTGQQIAFDRTAGSGVIANENGRVDVSR